MKNPRWPALCLLTLLAGCAGWETISGGSSASGQPARAAPKPDWVTKGSRALRLGAGVVVYGVGSANAMPNVELQWKAADGRSCEEAASILRPKLASLMKDFAQGHAGLFQQDPFAVDELVRYVSKSAAEAGAVNCRFTQHWEDAETGAFFSLAQLDMDSSVYDQYKESLKRALQSEHPAFIKDHTEEALKNLDAEIEKQRKREKKILGL